MTETTKSAPLQNDSSASSVARGCGAVAYHEIIPGQSNDWYTVSLDCYREHLAVIAKCGGPVITFDDGTLPSYENGAAPLREHGLRGTFFVCAGLIGTEHFMRWSQLRELVANGNRIQSHGWSHRLLTRCNAKQLELELLCSRLEIESRVGSAVTQISMPGGRVDERVIRECARAGYTTIFTSDPCTNYQHPAGVAIRGRMMMTRNTRPATLAALASGSPALLWKLRAVGSLRAAAKASMGDVLYHRLWRTMSGRTRTAQASSVQS